MRFDGFEALSFDCYGTLIDWESGILAALRPLLSAHGVAIDDAALLELYAGLESAAQDGRYRPYREVLGSVVLSLGERLGFKPSAEEQNSLAESIADWQPFPDTVAALEALDRRFDLVVISNIDDDLFEHSAARLGVPFRHVITAQQARSYKPSHNNFHVAFERMGRGPEGVLHVAQSLHHDIAPAQQLGLRTVWVNRRAGREGSGATVLSTAEPDLEVQDLGALVRLIDLDA